VNPGLLLFEAHPLYSLPVAFLLICCVAVLAVESLELRPWRLVAFGCLLNVVILTRSAYHLCLVIPAGALIWSAARSRRRLVFVLFILASSFSAAWYAKNYSQFGFFGSSSWLGYNLWRATAIRFSSAEKAALVEEGAIDSVMAEMIDCRPQLTIAAPSQFRRFGYDSTSAVSALSRNNANNINVVAISNHYFTNSLRIINADRWHYLANVADAYRLFCGSATGFRQLAENREKMRAHAAFFADVLEGGGLAKRIGEKMNAGSLGSFHFALLPITLLGWLAWWSRGEPKSWTERRALVGRDAAAIAAWGLVLYTAVVSSALEHGENARFRFEVEALCWGLMWVLAVRLWRKLHNTGAETIPQSL